MASSPASDHGSFFAGTIDWITDDFDGNIRSLSTPDIGADEVFAGGNLEIPVVVISQADGTVLLEWDPVAGAASYRIEYATEPYGEFYELASTDATSYSETADERRFYRVIASSESLGR